MQTSNVDFEEREYGKKPLSERELREIIGTDPIANYLNSRTPLYREMNMKEKPPSKEEAIKLMLNDQNLLKRPIFVKGKNRLIGFDDAEVKSLCQSASVDRRD